VRAWRRPRHRAGPGELGERRQQAAHENRQQAEAASRRAELAEQRARIAEHEAQRERAEAELQTERALMHERGLADNELVGDEERDRFAGTSAVRADDESAIGRDRPADEEAAIGRDRPADEEAAIGRDRGADDDAIGRDHAHAANVGAVSADETGRRASSVPEPDRVRE
jgi:hypothetical protein